MNSENQAKQGDSLLDARIGAGFVRHASIEAIEAALSEARAEFKLAEMRAMGLETLLEVRRGQVKRGEWPDRKPL
jgi:hypothetical protein